MTRVQAPPAGTGQPPVAARGMGRAAVVIGVITIVPIAGLSRQPAFTHPVGTTRLGTALSAALPVTVFFLNAAIALLTSGCVAVVPGTATLALGGGDLRAALAQARAGRPGGGPAR